jgi:hypothetical protein
MQVMEREPVSVTTLNPATPRDLETICHKCLQKDPAKRYTSAQEFADDLRGWLSGEPISARRVSDFEKLTKYARRNRLSTALVCLVVIGISILMFPLCTLDSRILSAYASVVGSSIEWFLIADFIAFFFVLVHGVVPYIVLPAVFRAGSSVAEKTFRSEPRRHPRKTPEEVFWQTILGLSIGAPVFCLVMVIIQIIRLLRGKTL